MKEIEDGLVQPGISSAASGVRDGELPALLARVEQAEGPDRELFADIAASLMPSVFGRLQRLEINGPDWLFRNLVGGFLNARAWESAALALCERVLPGTLRQLYERNIDTVRRDWVVHLTPAPELVDTFTAKHSTAPIALIAAMLKALIASPKDDTAERSTEPRETRK